LVLVIRGDKASHISTRPGYSLERAAFCTFEGNLRKIGKEEQIKAIIAMKAETWIRQEP
jgi:hypothetical protein